MRKLLAAVLFSALAQGASGQSDINLHAVPTPEGNTETGLTTKLQEFVARMEEAGFTAVQISPGLVLQAKDKNGQSITMLVDPQRMVGIELKGSAESETTGSGGPIDDLQNE